ncbi:putative nucleoporin complex subunit 54-domain-containing protein [Blattamonas nauphoetae]|uniref:Nucleoporin complex subunit 54-domain-containing protein n=1 Tax=Blattamonas nauphoetae TaxID=2049346 RepID=A0ABQ9X487_9EUKA|nr:putative nucleoporin complex subunit 54-domain-containing protein [Blattamonas nauphoetae]
MDEPVDRKDAALVDDGDGTVDNTVLEMEGDENDFEQLKRRNEKMREINEQWDRQISSSDFTRFLPVAFHSIRTLSSQTNLSWILSTIACSSYDNCDTLIKSGLCLAILEKATPSIVTKQSAHLYVHRWKILESISENATLSSDPTINVLLPSLITETVSSLLKLSSSMTKVKGTSPLTAAQRSALFRSFINFTVNETVSSMVCGMNPELLRIIESNLEDLKSINQMISQDRIDDLNRLLRSVSEYSTFPSMWKRGLELFNWVISNNRHSEILLTLFHRILSTNEAEIQEFVRNNGFSHLRSLDKFFDQKAFRHVMDLQLDLNLLILKSQPLVCDTFIMKEISCITRFDADFQLKKQPKQQQKAAVAPLFRVIDCYPKMTKENQKMLGLWLDTSLLSLLARVCIAGHDAEDAMKAVTLLTKLDEQEVKSLLQDTPLSIVHPSSFKFETSNTMPQIPTCLSDLFSIRMPLTDAVVQFHHMLPVGLCNRLSVLLDEKEQNKAVIEQYCDFIVKTLGNEKSAQFATFLNSSFLPQSFLLLYSLIPSERVKNSLLNNIAEKLLYPNNIQPKGELPLDVALLQTLLPNAPDIPCSTIMHIDKMFSQLRILVEDHRRRDVRGQVTVFPISEMHSQAMARLIADKDGRWRALTELAVVPTDDKLFPAEHSANVLDLLDEAKTAERVFVILRVLSKHTISPDFLQANPTFVERIVDLVRQHVQQKDNLELALGIFTELARLQQLDPSLEGELVDCLQGLASGLAEKRTPLIRNRWMLFWSSGENLLATIEMIRECTSLVEKNQLTNALPLVPIVSQFLCSDSVDLFSEVLDFLSTLELATKGTSTPFDALALPIAILDDSHQPTRCLPLSDFIFKQWALSLELTRQMNRVTIRQEHFFYPMFDSILNMTIPRTMVLVMRSVLGSFEQYLRDRVDCVKKLRTNQLVSYPEDREEWVSHLIDNLIQQRDLGSLIQTMFQSHLNSHGSSFIILHLLPTLHPLFNTLHRLALADCPVANENRYPSRAFGIILFSVLDSVLNEMDRPTISEPQYRTLSKFVAFHLSFSEPDCLGRSDELERHVVKILRVGTPNTKILRQELHEEGYYDRHDCLLLTESGPRWRMPDAMNIGSAGQTFGYPAGGGFGQPAGGGFGQPAGGGFGQPAGGGFGQPAGGGFGQPAGGGFGQPAGGGFGQPAGGGFGQPAGGGFGQPAGGGFGQPAGGGFGQPAGGGFGQPAGGGFGQPAGGGFGQPAGGGFGQPAGGGFGQPAGGGFGQPAGGGFGQPAGGGFGQPAGGGFGQPAGGGFGQPAGGGFGQPAGGGFGQPAGGGFGQPAGGGS